MSNFYNKEDRNQEATVYVGNLDDRVTDGLIWELFLQAGPVGKPTSIKSILQSLTPIWK